MRKIIGSIYFTCTKTVKKACVTIFFFSFFFFFFFLSWYFQACQAKEWHLKRDILLRLKKVVEANSGRTGARGTSFRWWHRKETEIRGWAVPPDLKEGRRWSISLCSSQSKAAPGISPTPLSDVLALLFPKWRGIKMRRSEWQFFYDSS